MKGKKWLFRPIVFLLIISLLIPTLIASCDGDDTTGPAGETTVTVTVTDTGPTLAPGETIELTVANYFPAPAGQSTLLEEFGLELEERTDGRVQVEYFTGGTLLTAPGMFQGVLDGVADIGYSHVYYTAGRMPVTEILGLPLGYTTAWVGGHVMDDFYNEFGPFPEYDGVKVLWLNASDPSAIATRGTPIRTLEDLEGLVIRAPGLPGEIITALGGTPDGTPMPEVYDSISKGEIDGETSNWETLFAFKFAEVVDYTTSLWNITFPFPFYCVMNEEKYNSLPADIKEIFDTLVGEYTEAYNLLWNTADYLGRSAGEANGVEFITLSEAEGARFAAAVAPVIDNRIAAMVDAGYSQAEVEGWIDFIKERIEFWTAKQVRYHIKSAAGPAEVLGD